MSTPGVTSVTYELRDEPKVGTRECIKARVLSL